MGGRGWHAAKLRLSHVFFPLGFIALVRAVVFRPRRSPDRRFPGDTPAVGGWESCGRRGREVRRPLPEPATDRGFESVSHPSDISRDWLIAREDAWPKRDGAKRTARAEATDFSPDSYGRRMRSDLSAEIDRTAGRKPHLDSDQNPDLVLPDLRRKPVHPLPPHRRTPAVAQAEPPAVQGADNFSLLDPALAQRATGVRAAVRQGDNRLTGPEDRQAQAKDLAGSTPPRGDLIEAAHQHPIGHDTWHSRRQPGWKTASLGLASEASTTVDSTVPIAFLPMSDRF